jgi:hypothetical protein
MSSGNPSASTPVRSAEQRLEFEALRKANEIRTRRAELKRELTAGSVWIGEILAAPPACAQTQKVRDLLLAMPGYGPARVARLLAQNQVSHLKTVAGLSDRQREQLIRHFTR